MSSNPVKTAIIFAVNGQDGSHLADLLISKDYKVIGTVRRSSTDNRGRIAHLLWHPNFRVVEADITDYSSVMNTLINNGEDVDEVYNLAAQSHVATSFKQPGLTWDVTGKGCLNILQAIVDLKLWHVRFYQASSSEMFGASFDEIGGEKIQSETTKFLPQSPYAIAKCAAHYAVRLYREAYGLHASAGILFNHEGERRGDNFVTKKITNWIVDFTDWVKFHDIPLFALNTSLDDKNIYPSNPLSITTKLPTHFPKLRLGNLEAFRDWGYAGDYVEAMWEMLQQEYADDYVICTGKTHTIRDFLDAAFSYVGINNWENFVVSDPEFYRPAEVDYLRGDATKAREKLGWTPKHDLLSLVSIMIDGRRHEKLQAQSGHLQGVS